jgi:hypothetical protein
MRGAEKLWSGGLQLLRDHLLLLPFPRAVRVRGPHPGEGLPPARDRRLQSGVLQPSRGDQLPSLSDQPPRRGQLGLWSLTFGGRQRLWRESSDAYPHRCTRSR